MLFSKREHINFNIIFRLLGLLLFIEAGFMLIPMLTCLYYNEYPDFYSFMYSAGITIGAGLLIMLFTSSRNNNMGKREGILLTGLTWLFFSIFGALPFIFSPLDISISAAFFESTSGITTTGASVIPSVEQCSHGILLWRAITHLMGGMGIILFTLAVIPMLNKQSGVQLFNAEVTGITHDKVKPRISHTAKCLWLVYIVLSLALIVLLWLGPMNFFEAVCHSFSTMSTGGFSTKDASIEGFNSEYVKIVITIFMFFAGINFALLFNFATGNRKLLLKNDTFRWYLAIIFIAFAVICISLFIDSKNNPSTPVSDVLFQVISALTSTGFTGSNYTEWQGIPINVVLITMIIGSCAGSTAGGVKIDRIMTIIKSMKNELYKTLHPNTILPIRVNGKVVPTELITKTGTFFSIFVILAIIGFMCLISINFSTYDAIFTTISCITNNGLGYKITSANFAAIPDVGKWVMSFLMIIGRLEVFTIIIIFTKAFWNKE